MNRTLQVVAFAGSLRAGSFNKGLLRAAVEAVPANMRVETLDLKGLPLYDADLERTAMPPMIAAIKAKIGAADGMLVVTPEHNYSVSAVTKTVIEWASRPSGESVLDGLPVAVMGVSTGGFGTVRAQTHFRDMAPESGFFVMQDPEIRVNRAREKFDARGNLTDEHTREELAEFMKAFAAWIERLKPSTALNRNKRL